MYNPCAGVWWLRSPYANNTNNAGVVNNDGKVNNNNVDNGWSARPASPYRPMIVPSGAIPCKLFWAACLHKAKEPNSLSHRCQVQQSCGKTHTVGEMDADGKRNTPQSCRFSFSSEQGSKYSPRSSAAIRERLDWAENMKRFILLKTSIVLTKWQHGASGVKQRL